MLWRSWKRTWADPGAYKSGEYLEEHVVRRAGSLVGTDRVGLIDALREWLDARSEPRTMLAVRIADRLHLTEVRPEICDLRVAIERDKAFPRFYLEIVDGTLERLG